MKYICEYCKSNVSDSQKFCHVCGGKFDMLGDEIDRIIRYGFAMGLLNDEDDIIENAEYLGCDLTDVSIEDTINVIINNLIDFLNSLEGVDFIKVEEYAYYQDSIGTIGVYESSSIREVISNVLDKDKILSTEGYGSLFNLLSKRKLFKGVDEDVASCIDIYLEFFE